MTEPVSIYVFRALQFAKSEAVVTAAPVDCVVSVFGGGGMKGELGLATTFGGYAYFRDDATGAAYLGVWEDRNAARFRRRLRDSGLVLHIICGEPPGRLVLRGSGPEGQRPKVR